MPPRVLVVIPACNEEKTIAKVLHGLRQTAPDYDRLVVNDGSSDSTGSIVAALGERQLRLVCNLGYGLAVQTGLKYALQCGYDIVVTIDADGQHRPQDVPCLVEAMQRTNADLVIGSRFCQGRYNSSLGRRIGQITFSHLTYWLTGQRIYDTTSGFKALSASACAAIVPTTFMDFHTETIVRLSQLGYRLTEVPIEVLERAHGRSMHSLASAFKYPLQMLVLSVVAMMDVFLARRRR